MGIEEQVGSKLEGVFLREWIFLVVWGLFGDFMYFISDYIWGIMVIWFGM